MEHPFKYWGLNISGLQAKAYFVFSFNICSCSDAEGLDKIVKEASTFNTNYIIRSTRLHLRAVWLQPWEIWMNWFEELKSQSHVNEWVTGGIFVLYCKELGHTCAKANYEKDTHFPVMWDINLSSTNTSRNICLWGVTVRQRKWNNLHVGFQQWVQLSK